MSWWEAIFLGLLQGFTEFLPVSSSGHLVIFQHVFQVPQPGVTFEVMVHIGTMFSVIIVFWKDLVDLFQGLFSKGPSSRGLASNRDQKRLFVLLLAGTVVTGLIGVILGPFLKGLFQKPIVTGFMLLVTGFIVFAITRMSSLPGKKDTSELSIWDGVFVGACQGVAIIPGISRSGTTIFAALFRGMDRKTAIKYSFLLSLPAIGGAALLEALELFRGGSIPDGFFVYVVAAILAFVSGVFAIKVFINFLNQGKFHYFSYYCWFAGSFTILYFLVI